MKKLTELLSLKKKSISIQVGIAISFTVVALFAMGAFGITMYHLFTNRMEAMMSENAVQLLDQTATNLESYLKNMRRISEYHVLFCDQGKIWHRRYGAGDESSV